LNIYNVLLFSTDPTSITLLLLNVLLTSCYSFFTMSIVYLVGQAQIYECYKDTNRIECSFMFLLFGIIILIIILYSYNTPAAMKRQASHSIYCSIAEIN